MFTNRNYLEVVEFLVIEQTIIVDVTDLCRRAKFNDNKKMTRKGSPT